MFWGRTARVYDKYSDLMTKESNIKEKFKIALISTEKVISEDYLKKNPKNNYSTISQQRKCKSAVTNL